MNYAALICMCLNTSLRISCCKGGETRPRDSYFGHPLSAAFMMHSDSLVVLYCTSNYEGNRTTNTSTNCTRNSFSGTMNSALRDEMIKRMSQRETPKDNTYNLLGAGEFSKYFQPTFYQC